jgi:hypothetical protein
VRAGFAQNHIYLCLFMLRANLLIESVLLNEQISRQVLKDSFDWSCSPFLL